MSKSLLQRKAGETGFFVFSSTLKMISFIDVFRIRIIFRSRFLCLLFSLSRNGGSDLRTLGPTKKKRHVLEEDYGREEDGQEGERQKRHP
jgi:hypothetical protein